MGFMPMVGMVAVMWMVMLVLPIFIVTALAIGAVALANMLFLLLDDDPVPGNGHIKAAFALKNDLLFIKAIHDHGRFKGVHNRGVGVSDLAYINENTLACGVVVLKKINYCIGLWRIKLIIEANVEVFVTEAVCNV
ncbi:MAG: hypothetical protein BCS36_06515 [Desulfovibrio sp. MES5]|nr:MAG: hypothetical protein BCS36_06515 [Desulfovibrio sp. MES5]